MRQLGHSCLYQGYNLSLIHIFLVVAWILAFSVQHIGSFYGKMQTVQKWLNGIVGCPVSYTHLKQACRCSRLYIKTKAPWRPLAAIMP